MIKIFVAFFFLLFSNMAFTEENNKTISLDMQNIRIQDALHILAKFLHENIVISPGITGTTSLHLNNMSKQEAFDYLLASHHLKKKKIGRVWMIQPYAEFMLHEEEERKLKTLLDETVSLTTHVWRIRYAKAEDIARLLQENNNSFLSKRGHVRVDERTNSVFVQDIKSHLIEVERMIKHLDVPVQQVVIEARLASIDNDYERELGINFGVKQQSDHSFPQASMGKRYSLAIAKLADGSELDIQLAALEKEGHGELISSPSLFTANQQTASIEAGEEIPYQEVSESGGTAVAFKKAVLRLKVTPQILPENKVLLQLQVNQDRPSNRIVLGVPSINTRQISTHVLISNGQTIVLGGIYESNHEQGEHRLPFFGKIPLVGWLFKQQNVQENKRELLIFVTPKIIPDIGSL